MTMSKQVLMYKEEAQMNNKEYLSWVDFYADFADKRLPYATDRQTLIEKVKAVYSAIGMRLPKLEKDNNIVDIDPFTIYGLFNKGITNANRIKILQRALRNTMCPCRSKVVVS